MNGQHDARHSPLLWWLSYVICGTLSAARVHPPTVVASTVHDTSDGGFMSGTARSIKPAYENTMMSGRCWRGVGSMKKSHGSYTFVFFCEKISAYLLGSEICSAT